MTCLSPGRSGHFFNSEPALTSEVWFPRGFALPTTSGALTPAGTRPWCGGHWWPCSRQGKDTGLPRRGQSAWGRQARAGLACGKLSCCARAVRVCPAPPLLPVALAPRQHEGASQRGRSRVCGAPPRAGAMGTRAPVPFTVAFPRRVCGGRSQQASRSRAKARRPRTGPYSPGRPVRVGWPGGDPGRVGARGRHWEGGPQKRSLPCLRGLALQPGRLSSAPNEYRPCSRQQSLLRAAACRGVLIRFRDRSTSQPRNCYCRGY